MVKFSKELEAQLIPEWKDAFVNYWQLKKHVKKIKLSGNNKKPPSSHDLNPEMFGRSIFDPIRFVAMKVASCSSKLLLGSSSNNTNEIIQVKSKSMDSDEEEVLYQTEIVQLFSEEDEVRVFFERLDGELNKVNQFYKMKESEFLERGEILNKQLQILLDLKQIVTDCQRRRKPVAGAFLQRSSNSFCSSRNSDSFSESAAVLNDSSTEISQTDEVIAALERNGVNFMNSASCKAMMTKKGKPKMAMRIDIPATTPARTISAVTSMIWEDLVNHPKKEGNGDFINKKKIQCAEKMIRSAFVELYRGLGLLKTYSSLNMVAFTKILKKFDKVSNQQASASYLKAVKRSHFISSDKVVRLMDEVESIFTNHFANNDRKKAMKFLRPQEQKNSHMVTFFVGLFTGSFVSLFSVYVILAHLSGIFSPSTETAYMETVYPVFSVFALLSLHLFLYGCNLFMWKATRINYNFIFEFASSTALKYRDAFLICTTFMTSVVGAMVIHLLLRAGGFSPSHVDTIPGILLLIFIGLLVCPFDIVYRPTRYCFLRIIRNIICSPLYKVLMVDFFMADQLTSQIPLLRHLESTACYFLAGSFKTHEYATCKNGKMYRQLAYVISFLPYYWRAMQCARRWFDEYDLNHLANMGKYVSAMVAAGARLTYATQSNNLWFSVVLVTSVVATVYQLYWDFAKDWGLLNPNSRNPWLRDDLILKNKSIYYLSIALNVVLRVAWVESIMRFRFNPVQTHLLDFFLASLEVIRRGHWNFYRLENEHLNNVGKFRAVKTVPLPFRETDSDG
ncbi:Phosphate transporter PHO1-2 [Hibiscus syriacus]|uniref:Phosphate transporter PHO1-2 n=1 Tax=Hibiscus syriacus TaxID=106335 RepID=A0A6A2XNX2_HIBSY|nr:phosphate transporter PHO1-like [Hibiscus syriacus]KAE8660079.1 Phosphate transporter PHO1-2 [Hibiscus syriacus]